MHKHLTAARTAIKNRDAGEAIRQLALIDPDPEHRELHQLVNAAARLYKKYHLGVILNTKYLLKANAIFGALTEYHKHLLDIHTRSQETGKSPELHPFHMPLPLEPLVLPAHPRNR